MIVVLFPKVRFLFGSIRCVVSSWPSLRFRLFGPVGQSPPSRLAAKARKSGAEQDPRNKRERENEP